MVDRRTRSWSLQLIVINQRDNVLPQSAGHSLLYAYKCGHFGSSLSASAFLSLVTALKSSICGGKRDWEDVV